MDHFVVLDDVYHTESIYRSLLVYSNTVDYQVLEAVLLKNDYSIVSEEDGRIYAYHMNMLIDDNTDIDWDSVSVVFCLGQEAHDFAVARFPNFACIKI